MAELSITEIRELIEKMDEVPNDFLQLLREDKRKGVNLLAAQLQTKAAHQSRLAAQWAEMSRFEQQLRNQGKELIVGIDEVGRGPLAGPVVACAVSLPANFYLAGLNDSKKVPVAMREAFFEVIKRDALGIGIGFVSAARIDEINILEATREAMRIAIANVPLEPDACLIDAVHLVGLPFEQIPIIGGDGKSVSIAAASIVAKVTRDRLMAEYAKEYPVYGFDKNVGYGTAEHLQAIEAYGPSPIHRLSFAGVKEWA